LAPAVSGSEPNGCDLCTLIAELNPPLRRLGEYYKRAHVRKLFQSLDGWEVRGVCWKVWRWCKWRESNKTLRQLLENIIFTKEVWTAALSGTDMDMNGPAKSQRSPQAMLQRLDKTDAELHRILSDVRNRSAWDDTFVDALCEPAETFTFGASSPIS
jgi:hypothetical protein